MMKTAKLIKDVRSEMGLTQKEFAELLGTSRENIANYETRVVAPGDVILLVLELSKRFEYDRI
jgi:DNA-binding transcriptional regulator YiaG